MSKSLKISLIIVCAIVAIGVTFFIFIGYKFGELGEIAVDKDYKIVFNDEDTVFIKASSWGRTGDHIQIQVSTFPIANRSYDSTKSYIFYEPTIYYQQKKDTLIIYSSSLSDLPSLVDTKIKIIQVEIDGPEEIKSYKENYKGLGLNEVSIYN